MPQIDPSRIPFTSSTKLTKELVAEESPQKILDIAIGYLGEDAMFNRVVLFALAATKIALAMADKETSEPEIMDRFEQARDAFLDPKAFLEHVKTWLGTDSVTNTRLIGDLALFLMMKNNKPYQSALKTLAEME